jgi:hypothetical protein
VQYESQFVSSLLVDFATFLASSRTSSTTAKENMGDVLQSMSMSATELAGMTQMGGGSHLLLNKLLFFFDQGFTSYRYKFPMIVFEIGNRRILKLSERLFLPPKKEDAEGVEEVENQNDPWYFHVSNTDMDNLPCFPFFVYPNAQEGWKLMQFTEHVYPIFHSLLSAIMTKGGEETDVIMTQQETRATQTLERIGRSGTDRGRAETSMAENALLDQLNITSSLQQTVVMFMLQFRSKYFDEFLQTIYQKHATDMTQLLQHQEEKGGEEEEQQQRREMDRSDSPILPDMEDVQEEMPPVVVPRGRIFVYDAEDQLLQSEEEED